MKFIQSAKNAQVVQWKKLLTKKERDKTGTFLVEGFHLVEEALKYDKENILELIIAEEVNIPKGFNVDNVNMTMVHEDVMKVICDTESPQGIVAICKQHIGEIETLQGKKLLLIDAVQDPGNVGTMIRTADAAGFDAIIIGSGSVDIYNPKVLRAAQGSHFHMPIIRISLTPIVDKLIQSNVPVYGTALENGVDYKEVVKSDAFALIVGNEGSGMSGELLQKTTKNLYIPIFGKSESLNVAVAAGILMYHFR